jgi:hypothetical protein
MVQRPQEEEEAVVHHAGTSRRGIAIEQTADSNTSEPPERRGYAGLSSKDSAASTTANSYTLKKQKEDKGLIGEKEEGYKVTGKGRRNRHATTGIETDAPSTRIGLNCSSIISFTLPLHCPWMSSHRCHSLMVIFGSFSVPFSVGISTFLSSLAKSTFARWIVDHPTRMGPVSI